MKSYCLISSFGRSKLFDPKGFAGHLGWSTTRAAGVVEESCSLTKVSFCDHDYDGS